MFCHLDFIFEFFASQTPSCFIFYVLLGLSSPIYNVFIRWFMHYDKCMIFSIFCRNSFKYCTHNFCRELTAQLYSSFFFHRGGLYYFNSIHLYIPFAALLGLTKRSKYFNRKVTHSQKFSLKSLSSSYQRLHFLMIKNCILKQHILRERFW